MTRIQVEPEELQEVSVRLRQAAGDLQAISGRLSSAWQSMTWESRLYSGMEAQAAAAHRLMADLAGQAETLSRYVMKKAREFAEADAAGAEELRAGTAGIIKEQPWWEQGAFPWLPPLKDWLGLVALLQPVVGLPFQLAGLDWVRRMVPGLFGPAVSVTPPPADPPGALAPDLAPPRSPEPERPTPPPGPNHTRLPNQDEVRFIQKVYGIEEGGYGPRTRARVRELQIAHGIPVDAAVMIGPRTWGHILGAYRAKYGVSATPGQDHRLSSARETEPPVADALQLKPVVPPQIRRWESLIVKAGRKHSVPPALIAAIIMHESGGENLQTPNSTGDAGLMQLNLQAQGVTLAQATDPEYAINHGTAFLKGLMDYYDGDWQKAIQAYHFGAGLVDRLVRQYGDDWMAHREVTIGDPQYYEHVMAFYERWR